MRSKSFPVRSLPHKASRKSLDPYPSPASFPGEANERRASGASTRRCDNGDADVEIVPETFDGRDVPHKKRHCLGKSDTSRGRSEELSLDACIVCDKSDERVSRCSGIDCLLSFHWECLNPELGSNEEEDLANSYCPYCWFKVLILKHKSVREKAVGAEKEVFKYLDKEMKGRDEVEESVPKSQEDKALYGDEIGNQDHSVDRTDIVSDQELRGDKDDCLQDSGKSREEDMPLIEETDCQPQEDTEKLGVNSDKSRDTKEDKVIDEVEASEDENRKVDTEKFQDAEEDKDEETAAKDQTKVNTGAGEKGVVSPFLSMQESFSGKEQDQIPQSEKRRRRRRLILKDIDSEISSNESTNERNGEDVTEQITSSAQVVTSPSGKMKNQPRKHSATTKVDMSKTVRDISFFKGDQRRRLYWTPEEEQMLKVGVEKFAAEAKKNMPWRKILEMGEKVFHETRCPADLKDKWRNMKGGRLGKKPN